MGRKKDRATCIHWSQRPDLQEAMAAIDHEHLSRRECAREFERRTGIALNLRQVSHWREINGRADTRHFHGGGRKSMPIGHELKCKGYIYVKVRERPEVPETRDNWRLKHIVEWERANGPLPEGHRVFFADHDRSNFAPENLVAVPTRLMGPLNSPGAPKWHDAESLRACMALAELTVETNAAQRAMPRRCRVCGASFVPQEGQTNGTSTCPKCLGNRYGR